MRHKRTELAAFGLTLCVAALSGCGKDAKDEAMGQLITDCQMRAHSAMENSTLSDEKKHFALGAFVERCLKENGLQASDSASCFEPSKSSEEGAGFIKPLQQCWKNTRSSKG